MGRGLPADWPTQAASPGSKMAQDARRAMRILERQKDKGKGRAVPEVPSSPSVGSSSLSPRSAMPDLAEDPFAYLEHESAYDAASFINEVANAPLTEEERLEQALEANDINSLFDAFPLIEEDKERTPQATPMGPPPMGRLPLLPRDAIEPPVPPLPHQYLSLPRPPGPMLAEDRPQAPEPTGLESFPQARPLRRRHTVFDAVPRQQNAVGISWAGIGNQKFALITDLQITRRYDHVRSFDFEVAPQGVQIVEVPPAWAGRVQKLTGREDDPATWAELTFDGYKGMTFFNVSYAHGNNGPIVVRDPYSSAQAGCRLKATDVAPYQIMTRDFGNNCVVCATDTGPSYVRTMARRFYREFLHEPHMGSADVDDQNGWQATHSKHLFLEYT